MGKERRDGAWGEGPGQQSAGQRARARAEEWAPESQKETDGRTWRMSERQKSSGPLHRGQGRPQRGRQRPRARGRQREKKTRKSKLLEASERQGLGSWGREW